MSIGFSVIIPTYNRARLIGATIESILRQSVRPAEVIVVDDGSVDDTASVVAGYAPRVTYIRSENRGPPTARNLGLGLANMSWLALCDSDDLWEPDHLAGITQLARAAPELQYIFTNFTHFTDAGCASQTIFDTAPPGFWPLRKREPFPGGWVLDEPLYPRLLTNDCQPIFPSATAFSREHLDRVGGFDEQLNRNPSEDLDFTLRSIREPPIGVLTRSTVGIRRDPSSFSGDGTRTVLGGISVLRRALEHHTIPEEWRDLLRAEIASRSAGVIDVAFGRRDFAALRSEAINPAELSARRRLKTRIARLPAPVANPIARLLLSVSELREHPLIGC
ncbi:MAG TPA: glycosyltransferase family A protein [Stellaceae bacterium]|jgi:glycosyltransferase involved in cell wall biosynthesis